MIKLTKEEEEEVNRLVKLLKDDRRSLRYHIALMLGLMGSKAKGATPALIEMLQKDKERTVRYQAARAMGLIREKTEQPVPALCEALKDRDWMVRKAAAWSLGWLGKEGKGAIEALIKAMNAEENKANKFTFALSLTRIERREGKGIAVLRRMQEEEELADWELFLFEDLSRKLKFPCNKNYFILMCLN